MFLIASQIDLTKLLELVGHGDKVLDLDLLTCLLLERLVDHPELRIDLAGCALPLGDLAGDRLQLVLWVFDASIHFQHGLKGLDQFVLIHAVLRLDQVTEEASIVVT